jgi:primosomal protein N'
MSGELQLEGGARRAHFAVLPTLGHLVALEDEDEACRLATSGR